MTAAWLQAVRERRINWDDYWLLLAALIEEIRSDQLILWRDGALLPGVLSVQERVTRLHLEQPNLVPVLHTHDAYYVALSEVVHRDTGNRVILVTNNARVWRCARALGVEVFHGNTCDWDGTC